jgi:adenylate kinase
MGIVHIASGDLLRDHQARGTELGNTARSYMQQGLLVPDELIIGMIEKRIKAPDAKDGYVLDGFPRTVEQAQALEKALDEQGDSIDRVANIRVSEEELILRLGGRWICRKCQRPYHEVNSVPRKEGVCDECDGELYQRDDDDPEAVSRRLKVFAEQTAPLIQYYSEKGNLVEVDGEGSIEGVRESLLNAVAQGGS